ncbi:MAG: hypothetical protein KDB09_06330 [Acidimicrobiales bacterium]|nr:hypothetical protein [Acidimicrobiales bacterium]
MVKLSADRSNTRGWSLRGRAAAVVTAVVLLAAAAVGCSGGDDKADQGGGSPDAMPELTPAPAELEEELAAAIDKARACDWLDESECMFPFPSSRFETDNPKTPTRRKLEFERGALPTNTKGVVVKDTAWKRLDGWGVGTPIMTTIAGVDPEGSNFPSEADPASSLEKGSGTVIVDMTTGERVAHWAELDARPEIAEADRTTVLLHPLTMLEPGHRYAVGIAQPVDGSGKPIAVSNGFRVIRDRLQTGIGPVEQRRARLDQNVNALAKAGLARADQWLAWDFTVMSDKIVTGGLITMRDQAFAKLGDAAPAFTVTEVMSTADDGGPLPEGVARRIRGTYQVPSFLAGDASPGRLMIRDTDDNPLLSGLVYTAEFTCSLTAAQLAGTAGARPVVYGHGLLGSARESERGDLGLAAANLMPCATNWIGMSEADIGSAVAALGDINLFPSNVDRLMQSVINQLFLARLMTHPDGFVAAPEFRTASGGASFDTSEVFYEGHSQGGIMGIVATAVSTEWTKAVIGVPGVDYSLLIPRSNNWQKYGPVIAGGYDRPVDGLLILALLQQLWDQAEGSGFARHLTTNTLSGTPEHQVIIQVALGDHQVANVSAEIAARTAGVPIRMPAVEDPGSGRVEPPFGMDSVKAGENATSLLIYWDAGTLPAPLGGISPDMAEPWISECEPGSAGDKTVANAACADPHEFPRRTPDAQRQRNEFFATGIINDVCGPDPCRTEPRNG